MPHPRYICIHGHFYQPPRENPWLEAIELQESAYPYHDWNERITAECYAPNARCRILDDKGRIVRIVNNYSKISFNFGPTLLSWLEAKAPDTYAAILEADRLSRKQFSGHGSAIAQVYNHIIMPLANTRDRLTQIRWGLADFSHRFGRPAEGMWLAETAVDLETLDLLSGEGVKFTILSPHQALQCKFLGDAKWIDVTGGKIDPTRPYEVKLPSGRTIDTFFYDGPISQAIAFEGLLKSGDKLAARLHGGFTADRDWPQLVHIATDGETYGHHAAHGDMALAYAIASIEGNQQAQLTNYGEYLERHPPTHEVEIIEESAWSCSHGLGRWSNHCGCSSGGNPGWSQEWRRPLRKALDGLRDRLASLFEAKARKYFPDPWKARDEYIRVLLDRRPESVDAFLTRQAGRALATRDVVPALKLLEMQRNCLLMYTSCGWFFDELAGIETVQVIAYAARALQLGQELSEQGFEPYFLAKLELAPSNIPSLKDGRRIYERMVQPLRVDLAKVAAHYAVSSLFEDYGPAPRLFCFSATADETRELGKIRPARLHMGQVSVRSEVTREDAKFSFAAVHLGELNLRGGVRPIDDAQQQATRQNLLLQAFNAPDLPEVIRLLDTDYAATEHSLKAVFRDEKRKILAQMLNATANAIETTFRQVYEAHSATMLFLQGLDSPVLPAFQNAAQFVLNLDLRRAFAAPEPNLGEIRRLSTEAAFWNVPLDTAGIGYALRETMATLVESIRGGPADLPIMDLCDQLLDLAESLSFSVDFWKAQNDYYQLLGSAYPEKKRLAEASISDERAWVEAFHMLGAKLRVCVPGVNEANGLATT